LGKNPLVKCGGAAGKLGEKKAVAWSGVKTVGELRGVPTYRKGNDFSVNPMESRRMPIMGEII